MHRRKLWLFAGVALAALALAATGSARVSGPDRASAGGTLVFGAEQGGGPDWCLNLILDVDCNAFWNVMFQTPVVRGAFLFTPKFTYQNDLISRYTFQKNPQRIYAAELDDFVVRVPTPERDLEESAENYERQVNAAVASDPEVKSFVERLEQTIDELEPDVTPEQIPSADAIARDFQRFLRQRGPSDPH